MTKLRKATALMATTLIPAGLLIGVTVNQAAAAVGPASDCVANNPDDYNGRSTTAYPYRTEKGKAIFHEYDELLTVVDSSPDDMRIQVRLEWCYNGDWRLFDYYDSGPNEGTLDVETYDLDFREGRRLRMIVCEKDGSDCGSTTYTVA